MTKIPRNTPSPKTACAVSALSPVRGGEGKGERGGTVVLSGALGVPDKMKMQDAQGAS